MLYIMRHGRTDWNDQKKLQGRVDIPLNTEGKRMAEAAAKEYQDVHFDICYCSPLIRARETAETVLKGRDIPIIFDDRLMEMSFGIYEGDSYSINDPDKPISGLFLHPESYKAVPMGESFEDLYARTSSFLKEKVEPALTQGKDVLIVGHGAMNLSIVCQVKDIPMKDFWSTSIENCKLLKLR